MYSAGAEIPGYVRQRVVHQTSEGVRQQFGADDTDCEPQGGHNLQLGPDQGG